MQSAEPQDAVHQVPIEILLEQISKDNESWDKLKGFFPELDFTEDLKKEPALAVHLRSAIIKIAPTIDPPLQYADAPKLNDDFSNYFVINNLPICPEAKVPMLFALIKKVFSKREIEVTDDAIDIQLNPETNETFGVAFIKMGNEEQARFGASIFDNFPLGGKHLATCLMPEFGKIMQTKENFEMPQAATNLQDLRAPIFDIKREQYFYKTGKTI